MGWGCVPPWEEHRLFPSMPLQFSKQFSWAETGGGRLPRFWMWYNVFSPTELLMLLLHTSLPSMACLDHPSCSTALNTWWFAWDVRLGDLLSFLKVLFFLLVAIKYSEISNKQGNFCSWSCSFKMSADSGSSAVWFGLNHTEVFKGFFFQPWRQETHNKLILSLIIYR